MREIETRRIGRRLWTSGATRTLPAAALVALSSACVAVGPCESDFLTSPVSCLTRAELEGSFGLAQAHSPAVQTMMMPAVVVDDGVRLVTIESGTLVLSANGVVNGQVAVREVDASGTSDWIDSFAGTFSNAEDFQIAFGSDPFLGASSPTAVAAGPSWLEFTLPATDLGVALSLRFERGATP